ncbi:hypothetical protein FBU30_002599 [Linnemannia zychae]|nr:hypothetical protein FBU30_002599 [Linnemannia zychae]
MATDHMLTLLFHLFSSFSPTTLAPKLNGGKLPSRQPTPGNNISRGESNSDNNIGQESSSSNQNAQQSVNNPHQGRDESPSPSTNISGLRSVAQLQQQHRAPPPARQFNAFSKGFSGLGANVISNLNLSLNQQQQQQQRVVSKNIAVVTTSVSVNTPSHRQQDQNTANYPIASSSKSSGSSSNTFDKNSSLQVTEETSAADVSFGGDEFLLEGDELALSDLMGDLDRSKDKIDDDDIPLSWSPTPPRIAKTITLTSESPISPLRRFGTNAPNTAYATTTSSTSASVSRTAVSHTIASKSDLSPKFTSASSTSISSSSFRASATAAAAASDSTSLRSLPRQQPGSSNSSRVLAISSQETTLTRPNERDITNSQDWQLSAKPHYSSGHSRELDGKGLTRSKSSPNAGSSSSLPIRNKRRLPGPAGNLPRLSEEERTMLLQSRGVPFRKDSRITGGAGTSPNSSIKKKMTSVIHGPVDGMFANGAWEQMLKAKNLPDYKPSTLERLRGTNPLLHTTISDIDSRGSSHRGKIQWLIAMIKDFTPSEIDAAVTLMDPSGEMRGTIHISVLDHYKNNEIRIGTVLVLNNVSMFSPTPESHYLIITIRNISDIFTPGPATIILSQGSSQDRNSQKRRRIEADDSQETIDPIPNSSVRRTDSSAQLSGITFHSSIDSRPPRLTSPDWNSTPENKETSRSNDSSSRQVSQESQQAILSPNSIQDHNQKMLSRDNSNEEELGSQPKEVMFQSLRQTFGSSMTSSLESQIEHGEILVTPMITLGTMTPSVKNNSIENNSSKFLSSFAATPTLRKRASQSSTSQQSSNSKSDLTTKNGTLTRSGRNTSSQGKSSQGSFRSDPNSSIDWPDDFPLTDLDDDELETNHSITVPAKRNASTSPQVSRRPPPPHTSITAAGGGTALPVILDDEDEDDLDHLLDGIDESELFEFEQHDSVN